MRARVQVLAGVLVLAVSASCVNELSPGFGTPTATPTPSGTPTPTPIPTSTHIDATVKPTRCWQIAGSDGASIVVPDAAVAAAAFAYGTRLLLWQVQSSGAVSGNQADITTTVQVARAGEFEFNLATGTQTMGASLRVFLANITSLLYGSTPGGSAAQVCIVPVFDVLTAATTARITADPWDGKTGGIVVFQANTIDLGSAIIDVEGRGFRGGLAANGAPNNCNVDVESATSVNDGGGKGEGIDIASWTQMSRGNLWNGAGGGNSAQGGGGGGGNGGFGGLGGDQSSACVVDGTGHGKGGSRILLSPEVLLSFGGGGGAGQGQGGDGGDGGGVVWIIANVFTGTGEINASGMTGTPGSASTGGGGGGGAGGTIVIETGTSSWSGILRARGGVGGDAGATTIGQGGGGGGGRIVRDGTGGTAEIIAGGPGSTGVGGATAGDPGATY